MRSFNSMMRTIFSTLKNFLERCSSKAHGQELMMNFSKAKKSDHLTSLFSENELSWVLEASDFDTVDNGSPFLGTLFEAFCGLCCTAEVTRSITEYVDMVIMVFARNIIFEWTEKTIQLLEWRIRSFKKKKDFCLKSTKHQGCARRSEKRLVSSPEKCEWLEL